MDSQVNLILGTNDSMVEPLPESFKAFLEEKCETIFMIADDIHPAMREILFNKFSEYLTRTMEEIQKEVINMKDELKKEMIQLQEKIQKYEQNLDLPPFHIEISLSLVDLKQHLEKRLEECEKISKEKEKELQRLKEKCSQLCSNLNRSASSLSDISSLSKMEELLDQLNEECEQYEERKKQRVETEINNLKEKLDSLLQLCCRPSEEKIFVRLHSTDDLINIYENEIEKWNNYYEEHKDILEDVREYNTLVQTLAAKENQSVVKDRFKNRGGTLLCEENEKRKLIKHIQHLEDKLLKKSEKYFAVTGEDFLIFEEKIKEFIEKQHKRKDIGPKLKLRINVSPGNAKKKLNVPKKMSPVFDKKRDKSPCPLKQYTSKSPVAASKNNNEQEESLALGYAEFENSVIKKPVISRSTGVWNGGDNFKKNATFEK